jgi:hypothetical protein
MLTAAVDVAVFVSPGLSVPKLRFASDVTSIDEFTVKVMVPTALSWSLTVITPPVVAREARATATRNLCAKIALTKDIFAFCSSPNPQI